MYKKWFCVISALLTLSLAFVGCSDDCANCPNENQTSVMFGEVGVDEGQLEFYGMIFGIDGTFPDIDSVRVDGRLAELEGALEEGVGQYVRYESPDNDNMHVSGEIVYIEIFTPGGKSECNIKALEDDADEPELIMDYSPDWPYDTVAIGTDISFDWHPVTAADFYVVDIYYRWGPGDSTTDSYEIITDTSFTLPGSASQYDGYYYFYIVAVAGPNPMVDDGNITGEVVKGMINSSESEGFDLYIGDGDPYDGPVKSPVADEEHQTVDNIMNKIRGL